MNRSVRHRREVLGEDVAAEVAVEITPDRIHVIAVVLCVVVFDEERGSLHPVVIADARFDRPSSTRQGGNNDQRVIDALTAAAMVHAVASTQPAEKERLVAWA